MKRESAQVFGETPCFIVDRGIVQARESDHYCLEAPLFHAAGFALFVSASSSSVSLTTPPAPDERYQGKGQHEASVSLKRRNERHIDTLFRCTCTSPRSSERTRGRSRDESSRKFSSRCPPRQSPTGSFRFSHLYRDSIKKPYLNPICMLVRTKRLFLWRTVLCVRSGYTTPFVSGPPFGRSKAPQK